MNIKLAALLLSASLGVLLGAVAMQQCLTQPALSRLWTAPARQQRRSAPRERRRPSADAPPAPQPQDEDRGHAVVELQPVPLLEPLPAPRPAEPAPAESAPAALAAAPGANPLQEPYPRQPSAWEPLIALQMNQQINQLGETLRRIDDHSRRQQDAINQVVQELSNMSERGRAQATPQRLPPQQPPAAAPVELAPPAAESRVQTEVRRGEGDGRLTVSVHDADIRDVLELLGQQGRRNIVALPGVTGKVTLSLEDVSLDEALDAVLKSSGYVARRETKFIYVGDRGDFQRAESGELRTRVYRPNYITAQELQQMVAPLLTVGVGQATVGGQAGAPLAGAAGAVATVAAASPLGAAQGGAAAAGGAGSRSSATTAAGSGLAADSNETGGMSFAGGDAVLVRDFEHVLDQIDQVVAELDRRPRQVAIEAVILTVRIDDRMQTGVNFEALHDQQHLRLVSGASMESLADIAAAPGALKFGYLGSNVSSFIEALETVGDTDIVASPRLMCLNKQQAEILIGAELGYVNTTVTQTAATQSVEFLEVGTQLRFRPFITDDDIVRLELQPELSTGSVRIEEGLTLPDKEVTKVTTNILCRNGATVVIGGLMREDLGVSVSQLPYLGSLPYLGGLFRHRTQTTDRREIIVLITPRVVGPEADCEGPAVAQDFRERQDLNRDKMSLLSKRLIGQKYVRKAQAAWHVGDVQAAFRYCNLALHYHPDSMEVVHLRREILAVHPELDVPLNARVREGLHSWQRPHVNYPRQGVPWQSPAPIISPHQLELSEGKPGSIRQLEE